MRIFDQIFEEMLFLLSKVKSVHDLLVKMANEQIQDSREGVENQVNGTSHNREEILKEESAQENGEGESESKHYEGEYREIVLKSADMLEYVCELIHSTLASLMQKRGPYNVKLQISDFVELFAKINKFLTSTMDISGKECFSLKACILSQSKEYIATYHEKQLSSVSVLLDNEASSSILFF